MAGARLLVLCCVVAVAACQGGGSPSFCLELLRSENKEQTTRALVACTGELRQEEAKAGRKLKLTPQHFNRIGKCIAARVGIIQPDGTVNKSQLATRIQSSSKLTEQQRQELMTLLPTCNTWDSCLKQRCQI